MNLWHDPRALNAIANVMVMAAFGCLLLACIWWVGQRSTFDLLAIEVGPVNGRTLDHVDQRMMDAQGVNRLEGNFFTVGLDRVREHFEQVPWVRRAEVRRIWPNRLFVALEEHQALVARRYDELAHQLLPLSMQPVELELSDRQSWTARLDSGITLKMGRDEGLPVADRVARWVTAHPLIQARLNGRAEVIDLRYPNGFAVRAPGALEPHDGNGHPHRDNLH